MCVFFICFSFYSGPEGHKNISHNTMWCFVKCEMSCFVNCCFLKCLFCGMLYLYFLKEKYVPQAKKDYYYY